MTSETPGTRLRQAREQRGITRAQLAAKLGVGQSTIRAHENGQNGIQPAIAEQYAAELGVYPQWILYGRDAERAEPSPPPAMLSQIPIVGRARPGYFPDQPLDLEQKSLGLALPGYDRFALKAYLKDDGARDGHSAYVICAPWRGDALYLADEVVLRRTEGGLAEVDVWKVGADPGWIVFFKGPTQSQATELLKIRPPQVGHLGRGEGFWVLGLVVSRLEYLPYHRIRAFDWSTVVVTERA